MLLVLMRVCCWLLVVALLGGAVHSQPNFFEIAREGSVENVRAAIRAGANVNARGEHGDTPLMHAAWNNENSEVVQALLDAGANVNTHNERGLTPLMNAAWNNANPKVLRALLDAGANVETRDAYGDTAVLLAATSNQNADVMRALLDAGADTEARTGIFDWTPLMLAASSNPNPEVVRALLDAGAELEARDQRGETPLIYAARHTSNPGVVLVLLDAGADATATNQAGRRTIDFAQATSTYAAPTHTGSSTTRASTETPPHRATMRSCFRSCCACRAGFSSWRSSAVLPTARSTSSRSRVGDQWRTSAPRFGRARTSTHTAGSLAGRH